MKYLGKYENYLILEVGEVNVAGFEIKKKKHLPGPFGTNNDMYLFDTDNGLHYIINIMTNMSHYHLEEEDVMNCEMIDEEPEDFYEKLIGVSFFTYEDENNIYGTYDDKVITNRGDLFKIMSTLKNVIVEYLDENPNIKYIFAGGQRGEKETDKEQRDRLYLAYFKKQKPNWETCMVYCEIMGEDYPLIKITD
jgi:hypothetical protein